MSAQAAFPALERLTNLQGFGRATRRACYLYRPIDAEQVEYLLEMAAASGFSVALQGSARSYGDAPLNSGQVILDMRRMNRILAYDPDKGIICVEPGVTIQQIWQYVLEDGWWPAVVPGTMFPTVGGCLSMNVHGKNNWQAGTFGEHVLEFNALLPTGEKVTCSPSQNADLFHALISGIGTLGVFTSATIQLKRVFSGELMVQSWATPNLSETIAQIDRQKDATDYLVGWLDSTARGKSGGRGQLHSGRYLAPGEDAAPQNTLRVDYQTLPDTFFGVVPSSILWRLMTLGMNNFGARIVNTAKYVLSASLGNHKKYRQAHAAFHFLLDYIPNWRLSYGHEGLIQYQCLIPSQSAQAAFAEILAYTQRRKLPSYLAVIKRHRPDDFLLTHSVDGYSLALDFKVTRHNRAALQSMADELNRIVLQAQGRFYFAKDSTLTSPVVRSFLGTETLQRYREIKQRCDPQNVLQNDLYRRLLA